MTSERITELRKLHDGCVAQDLGRLDDERIVTVPVYRENAAFLIACNNSIQQILDEREALLGACKAMLASAAELNAPIGPEHMGRAWYFRRQELEKREHAALDAATKAIAKVEAP